MIHRLLPAVLGVILVPTVALAGPPLSDYAIFAATDNVVLGGNSQVSFVPGAPTPVVGSGYAGSAYAAVQLNGGAAVQGDVRSMGDVTLMNSTMISGTVYHAPGTVITLGSPATIGGEVIGDPELPTLPPAATCASGGTNYTIANGGSLPLAPGPYGIVQLGGACELNLSSGTYFFEELRSGNGLRLKVDLSGGPLRVYACSGPGGGAGFVDFGSVTTIIVAGAGGDPNTAASMIRFEPQGTSPLGWSFEASGSSNWLGDVVTPNGSIHFGGSGCCSYWNGRFHAQGKVDIEHAVTGSLPTQIVTQTTWGRVKVLYR